MLYLKGKLTDEEADFLSELISSEGFAVLVNKVLPVLIEARANRVLTQSIAEQHDLLKLAIERAEYDGAKKFAKDIGELKQLVTRKTNAPSKK